ncbi:hypothetical protein Godav_022922 [Gossypium davidsonii]|uniref:Zinc knuckle CX2CX4HX4C domain-containing protein n=2 Tax=Gossypium TaxID=3633 RepID=A0A7J8SQQ4_GOSDV|nr:hypothetical protein [Gossypium davidsonii]
MLGLPGHLYKRKILGEIGGLIGRVAKLDPNTVNRSRGRFVEYKSPPSICFTYGQYGHANDMCPLKSESQTQGKKKKPTVDSSDPNTGKSNEPEPFGPWMQVLKEI